MLHFSSFLNPNMSLYNILTLFTWNPIEITSIWLFQLDGGHSNVGYICNNNSNLVLNIHILTEVLSILLLDLESLKIIVPQTENTIFP